jgi:hypothetical protein
MPTLVHPGSLLAAALVIGVLQPQARATLRELLGLDQSVPSRRGRWVQLVLAGLLLALTLLPLLNFPELRVFLLLLDAIGIDVFVLLLGLQLRAGLAMLYPHLSRAWRGPPSAATPAAKPQPPWLTSVQVLLGCLRSPPVALALAGLGLLVKLPMLLLVGLAALTVRGQVFLVWARSYAVLAHAACAGAPPSR